MGRRHRRPPTLLCVTAHEDPGPRELLGAACGRGQEPLTTTEASSVIGRATRLGQRLWQWAPH